MLSKPPVYSRLAGHFIGLRFDWEQGNHYKDKFGFILGTGDQLLLTPQGALIRPDATNKAGARSVLYGRNGCDTTAEVLDGVIRQYPAKSNELKLEWFLWPQKPTRRPGGFYPASYASIAGYARLPYVLVDGPFATALTDSEFLRRHVRQFIWVRGQTNGASRLTIHRVKDGLSEGLPAQLASLDPGSLSRPDLSRKLDEAWLTYMKTRPLAARGYLENQHGKWMRSQASQMIQEEEELRARAVAGTLLPPGRSPGQSER